MYGVRYAISVLITGEVTKTTLKLYFFLTGDGSASQQEVIHLSLHCSLGRNWHFHPGNGFVFLKSRAVTSCCTSFFESQMQNSQQKSQQKEIKMRICPLLIFVAKQVPLLSKSFIFLKIIRLNSPSAYDESWIHPWSSPEKNPEKACFETSLILTKISKRFFHLHTAESTYTAYPYPNTLKYTKVKVLWTQDNHTQLSSFAWLCCSPIKSLADATRVCWYSLPGHLGTQH